MNNNNTFEIIFDNNEKYEWDPNLEFLNTEFINRVVNNRVIKTLSLPPKIKYLEIDIRAFKWQNKHLFDQLDYALLPNLKHLKLTGTYRKEIDFKNNLNLEELEIISAKDLENVDLSLNFNLKMMVLNQNNINELDLGSNYDLVSLNLTEMPLKNIDLSTLTHLEALFIDNLKELNLINLDQNKDLKSLYLANVDIEVIQLANNAFLKDLAIINNNAIKEVIIENQNNIKEIILQANKALNKLIIKQINEVKEINVSNNPMLENIVIANEIKAKLTNLYLLQSNLKTIELSNLDIFDFNVESKNNLFFNLSNINVFKLSLSDITNDRLDFSVFANLKELSLSFTKLDSLDLMNINNLNKLSLVDNQSLKMIKNSSQSLKYIELMDMNFDLFKNNEIMSNIDHLKVSFANTFDISNLNKLETLSIDIDKKWARTVELIATKNQQRNLFVRSLTTSFIRQGNSQWIQTPKTLWYRNNTDDSDTLREVKWTLVD
ncbi:hypothetical protein [Mycoplasma sp. HS2188]|uniref:hypothetical protein n=1 Tax=Mycoplasma sp. HS2188 TaxID=2976765 RepID=UPI0021AAF6E5|nr:hypothetical protein [Mycoplasma sp. HS2188]MCT4469971.1 hypothetical protein [Mycoplasma sp. HS2188]